jgi:hypothetical protein
MAKHYEEWTPEPFDPGTDALSAQVGERETEGVQRDPEIDAAPVITRVFNGRQASPQPATVDHYLPPGPSERVEVRGHLDQPPVSTDRHSDEVLNREAAEREAER